MNHAAGEIKTIRGRGTAALSGACGAHAVHDGFSDLLYLLLPFWQAEFGLTLAQVGFLKTAFSAAMASFQIPGATLGERFGERAVLVVGTGAVALGYFLFGIVGSFAALVPALVLVGLGAGVQHPLSSSLIAKTVTAARMRAALGTYNFFGDVGKVALPAAAAFVIAQTDWRRASMILGAAGLVAALAIFFALRAAAQEHAGQGQRASSAKPDVPHEERRDTDRAGFTILSSIGVVDSATRTGFLTFLPFLLTGKGVAPETLGIALALVFAGGAAGKFVCGMIADKVGIIRTVVITELATALGILLLLPLPLTYALALLPFIGVALNGTSSVLYGTVVDLVARKRRARAFGVFYTVTTAASAVAPLVYGFVSDAVGIERALALVAGLVLATLPLTVPLRRSLRPT